jgi:hypothetical protein
VIDIIHVIIKMLRLRGAKDSCCGLHGYDAVEPGRKTPKFLRNILPPGSTGMYL